MGNKCGETPRQEITVPQNPQQQQTAQRLAPLMGLEHPLNVNNQFQDFQRILPNQYTGTGIKKTQAYRSLISKEELEKKRAEFWETRTTGIIECWQALRCACEATEGLIKLRLIMLDIACAILQAQAIKLVSNTMQMVYDEQGNKYEIPNFCINDPVVSFDATQKAAPINFIKQQMTVKKSYGQIIQVNIRSTKSNKDTTLTVSNSILISELKKMYLGSLGLKASKMRLMVNGKEMIDNNPLGSYTLRNEQILQAFITDLK